MSYKIGLVGLPNVGKSSFFRFITKKEVLIANYPFATIEPNKGVFFLVDNRLKTLQKHWKSEKITPSAVEIIDIAGLVKGSSEGVGLGNQFLSHIKEVSMILHIVRCFKDQKIIHSENVVDATRDHQIIELELILADLQLVNSALQKKKIEEKEKILLEKIRKNLEKNTPVIENNLTEEEKKIIKCYNFLTNKPTLIIGNYGGGAKEEETTPLISFLLKKTQFSSYTP